MAEQSTMSALTTGDEQGLRRRILDASLALLQSEGIGALSLREVARRAGVSHQAPYHHFADREAILATIAREGFEELRRRMNAAIAGQGSVEKRLLAMATAYVTFALDRPAHFRVMFRPELVDLSRFPEAECAGNAAFQGLADFVEQLRAHLPRGGPGADVWTSMLWSQVHGLACLLLDGPLARKVPTSADQAAHVQAVLGLVARLVASQLPPPPPGDGRATRRARRRAKIG